ncbi:hypothetical protein [Clostridium butyricum]|nr:hypothetical protein [Clostridium butyricum]
MSIVFIILCIGALGIIFIGSSVIFKPVGKLVIKIYEKLKKNLEE